MGEFNLGDRKRGVSGRRANLCTRSASNFDFENGWSTHTPRSLYENNNGGGGGGGGSGAIIGDGNGAGSQQTDDVKDVNFWTSVFFNNGGSTMVSSSDLVKSLYSPASTATITSTATATTAAGVSSNDRKLIKKTPTTPSTYLLNNIISNAKNNRSKVIVNANNHKSDRDLFGDQLNCTNSVEPSSSSSPSAASFAFLNTMKQHDLLPKRKSAFDGENALSSTHQAGELDYQSDIGSERDNIVNKGSSSTGDFLQVCLAFFPIHVNQF